MEENNKNLELSINFIKRNDDKKKTISLSETPNIINDETLNIDRRKSDASSLFQIERHSMANVFLYQNKIRKSFIKEPISHNKDESRSTLSEIQMILKTTNNNNNENKNNKLIEKKERKKRVHSKKKNSVDQKSRRNKESEKEIEELKTCEKTKKKHYSSKKRTNNIDFDDEQKKEKSKKLKIKFRKSDIIRPFKKDSMVVGDIMGRRASKRKSLFSQQGNSPGKNHNEIFEKFFKRKNSLDSKEEKWNKDKIYINIKNKEESLITVNTTQKMVKNYYEYMQDCFQIIDLFFNKIIKLPPGEPVNFHFKENKKIVIFELESTLVSSIGEDSKNDIKEENNTIGINIRPHLKSSLDLIKNDYNIVIYSSSNQIYVDKILDFLDPNQEYFNYRLYQNHCHKFNICDKTYYTKNLNIFKGICDLKDIIVVDCSVLGFGFFLDNGIPIIPFYDSKEDVELKLLSYYLVCIASNYDLRVALKRDMKLDSYLEMAKQKNGKTDEDENEEQEKEDNKKHKRVNIKSSTSSPMGAKRKMKKQNKTNKINNRIHFPKENSESDEDKKSIDNNHKIHEKTKKHKKESDKRSPKKDRYDSKLKKKNNRKYTINELNRYNMNIKSPKKTSPEKSHKDSSKKAKDRNKIFTNDG